MRWGAKLKIKIRNEKGRSGDGFSAAVRQDENSWFLFICLALSPGLCIKHLHVVHTYIEAWVFAELGHMIACGMSTAYRYI